MKLERVCFGSILRGELKPYVHWLAKYSTDNHNNMSRLIESLSAGFRSRALSSTLSIRGLRCLRSQSFSNNDCQVCRRACESFPLAAVASFECQESSCDQVFSSRPYDLDVCLGREQVVSSYSIVQHADALFTD